MYLEIFETKLPLRVTRQKQRPWGITTYTHKRKKGQLESLSFRRHLTTSRVWKVRGYRAACRNYHHLRHLLVSFVPLQLTSAAFKVKPRSNAKKRGIGTTRSPNNFGVGLPQTPAISGVTTRANSIATLPSLSSSTSSEPPRAIICRRASFGTICKISRTGFTMPSRSSSTSMMNDYST